MPHYKTPIQIRLDDEELARLDAQRATEGRFPPDRPTVVKRALLDWLAQQHAARGTRPPEQPDGDDGYAQPRGQTMPDAASARGRAPTLSDPDARGTGDAGPLPPSDDKAARERERKRRNKANSRAKQREKGA
jgi:hypothetical protein